MNAKLSRKAMVTGGAGFIGSHIVDHLLRSGADVVVYDNLSTGFRANLPQHERLQLIEADILDLERLCSAMSDCDAVFHFQANADVRGGITQTRVDFEQNTTATWNVLECMRLARIKTIIFASSATVYGEPAVFPTPETEPLIQTSLYGASKLACEAMIQAYAEYFNFRSITFRFVSWIGPRYSHGVIFDLLNKLRANPHVLEILGDGNQQKSYLDVRDGIAGIFLALEKVGNRKAVFNLGHEHFLNVLDLARIVIDEAGLKDVHLRTTGGKRGWLGDSPLVHLDTSRIKQLGWKPQIPIENGIRATVRHLLDNAPLLTRS